MNTLWLKLAAAVGFVLALLAAVFKLLAIGRDQERGKQAQAQVAAVKAKKEADDEVDNLGSADIDRELARWMRDDKPAG